MTYAQLGWLIATLAVSPLLAVGYALRLFFGGLAAGAGHVASHLRYLVMPFAHCLKRAQGFRRIHGAWVKPRQNNRRRQGGFVDVDDVSLGWLLATLAATWTAFCWLWEFVASKRRS